MTLLLRTRPKPVVASVEASASSVDQRRRLRTTSANTAASRAPVIAAAKKLIDEQLKLIAKAEAKIDEATRDIDNANGKIEDAMRDVGILEHLYGVHCAEIVEQWTNQRTSIDPRKFRAKVSNEAFWGSIEVALGKARTFLNEQEILAIADVVPSQKVGTKLKITRVDVKRRGKK